MECAYPNPKPSSFVPITMTHEDYLFTDANVIEPEFSSGELLTARTIPELALDVIDATSSSLVLHSSAEWFAAPETFLIDHTPMPLPPNFKIHDLETFVEQIDIWMREWVATGSNAFIHAQLYGEHLPSCLQVAFTTFSAYTNKTPASARILFQTVNDQATALLSQMDSSGSVLQDLACMHALLVYQMIGLFDGDIRSRHLAESRAPLLAQLSLQTLENASATLLAQLTENEHTMIQFNYVLPEEPLWRTWIISESLRRTWLIVQAVAASYDGLKQGWAPCNGDVKFTTREGLWSARSASLWASICVHKDVRFVGRFRAQGLFEVPPGEVDEFAKVMLETVFGKEKSVKWKTGSVSC